MAACSSASRASSFQAVSGSGFDKSRHIQRSLLFVHLPLFSSVRVSGDPEQVVIVNVAGDGITITHPVLSCPVSLGRIMAQHIN